jgi:site-specific DNA recombinase
VRAAVAELVRDSRVVAAMHPENAQLAAAREQRSMIAARLGSFETDHAMGRITGAQLQKATASVNGELAHIDAKLAPALRRSTSSTVTAAADPGSAFLEAPIDVQRAVLAMVLKVEIQRATIRGASWSGDRLKITPVG